MDNLKKYLDIENKKIFTSILIITLTLASTLSIYAFTRDTLPKFILKDKKTIKLEYGEKYL